MSTPVIACQVDEIVWLISIHFPPVVFLTTTEVYIILCAPYLRTPLCFEFYIRYRS